MSDGASLLDRVKHLIDSGGLELPVFSDTALRIQMLAAGNDFDMNEVERLIRSDQTLAVEVLRAANSPFFGGLAPIQTIQSAVVRLGIKHISRLVFLASERSKYDARDPELRRKMQTLWAHASTTSLASHWLAKRLSFKELEEEAFLGGLLHDVGQLVILRALDEIRPAKDFPFDFSSELVEEILQSAHPELGYDLLKHRNIPDVYCRIARDHHLGEFNPTDVPLLLVRLANHATRKLGISLAADPTLNLSALAEAQCLGASEIMLAELEIMLEDHVGRGQAEQESVTTNSGRL